MAKPGDRVIVEGTKVGGGRREGTLVAVLGRLIRVRWDGGAETLLTPAAGAVRFLPGSSKTTRADGATRGAAKKGGKQVSAKGAKKGSPSKGKTKRR